MMARHAIRYWLPDRNSELGDDEGVKEDANDAFRQALQEEELHVTEVIGELFISNTRGLSLAERVRVIEQQFTEIPSLETKISSLEDTVRGLTCPLDTYNLLRNRFIGTFKRDRLENENETEDPISPPSRSSTGF